MIRTWNDITLYQYQQVDAAHKRKDYDEMDKVLFCVCAVFGMTEYELDQSGIKVVDKLCKEVNKIFAQPFPEETPAHIGKYFINYNCEQLNLGQYVELQYFLSGDPIENLHKTLASISHEKDKPNGKDHSIKADYFLSQPITATIGAFKQFTKNFAAFNAQFKNLFGLDENTPTDNIVINQFNKNYGWMYAATQVAKHERITLDQAMQLPIRQALNGLMYLKQLGKYHTEISKIK
jgi:hypothetical protein